MIAVPIVAPTYEEALRDMERAEKIADVVEIRMDLVPRESWIPLLGRQERPSIVTLRPERQGGSFRGEETRRIQLLENALNHHPDFIDVEWDTPSHLIKALLKRRSRKTKVIVSYHNLAETPDDLEPLVKKVASCGGHILKIVTLANDFVDNTKILRFVERQTEKTIAFCMGPFGVPSRILTLRAGGYLTFGALDKGKESASGQLPARDLKEIYRTDRLHPTTRVFGLIGNPVFHSLSPDIHNAAFDAVGFDAVYVPLQIQNFGNLAADLASIGVEGFSVTMPHKEQILHHLNGVDLESGRMRAVNTVYRQNGQWLGTNTDVYGAWKALEGAGAEVQGKRWTILGTGGVARAVACGAVSRGRPSALTVLGRTPKRLDRFLEDLREVCTCPIRGAILEETDLGEVLDETEILVNGTPVGMIPEVDRTPIPFNLLNSHHLVFDTIYNPVETRLLREAKERGCRTVSGLTMFLHQGAAQFERWTGKKAPFSIMERKARARLER